MNNIKVRVFTPKVDKYMAQVFESWCKTNKEELEGIYERIIETKVTEEEKNDIIHEQYEDEFCFDIVNNWDKDDAFNFYKSKKDDLGHITANQFISMWAECENWYNEQYDVKTLLVEDEERAWNTLAYWCFETTELKEEWESLFSDFFEESLNDYIESKDNRPSRIACGICYENTILYTGCSRCNENYLCKTCYKSLESENECPFCRYEHMIDYNPKLEHMVELMTNKRINHKDVCIRELKKRLAVH